MRFRLSLVYMSKFSLANFLPIKLAHVYIMYIICPTILPWQISLDQVLLAGMNYERTSQQSFLVNLTGLRFHIQLSHFPWHAVTFTRASFEHDKFFSVFVKEKLVMLPHSNEQIKLVKLKIVKENLLLGFSNMLLFNFFPSNIYCTLCFERKQPGENSDMKQ